MIDDYNTVINSFHDFIIFNYYLINEVILYFLSKKNYFVTIFLLLVFLFWVTYSVSSTNYLGVPNAARLT